MNKFSGLPTFADILTRQTDEAMKALMAYTEGKHASIKLRDTMIEPEPTLPPTEEAEPASERSPSPSPSPAEESWRQKPPLF